MRAGGVPAYLAESKASQAGRIVAGSVSPAQELWGSG